MDGRPRVEDPETRQLKGRIGTSKVEVTEVEGSCIYSRETSEVYFTRCEGKRKKSKGTMMN